MSVRPMRPPAPATISRMSDIGQSPRGAGIAGEQLEAKQPPQQNLCWLRAVVAFDHDDVGSGLAFPHFDRLGVFRRTVASERGIVIFELDHDVALAALAFDALVFAAPDDEMC